MSETPLERPVPRTDQPEQLAGEAGAGVRPVRNAVPLARNAVPLVIAALVGAATVVGLMIYLSGASPEIVASRPAVPETSGQGTRSAPGPVQPTPPLVPLPAIPQAPSPRSP